MIRLATFNVENLFDRPLILNLKDQEKAAELLDMVKALQLLITKPSYSPADKSEIFRLYQELKDYIEIQEDVGKLFRRSGGFAITGVSASGASSWYGGITFKRSAFKTKQRENTAAMIKKINADIQCLVEVEGMKTMEDFNSNLLSRRFKQFLSIDSPIDPRGIDLGLYLRDPTIASIRTNMFDRQGSKQIWSRDCLEVACKLPSGETLHVLINHFKSKFGGDTPDAIAKRTRQAERVVEIVGERYDPAKDLYAVMGDLNDTPDSVPMHSMMNTALFKDVFDVTGRPADDRWTYYYGGNPVAKRRTQIDYIFVSPKLAQKVRSVDVLRRGMSAVAEGKILGVTPYSDFTGQTAASDHAAIVVELDL